MLKQRFVHPCMFQAIQILSLQLKFKFLGCQLVETRYVNPCFGDGVYRIYKKCKLIVQVDIEKGFDIIQWVLLESTSTKLRIRTITSQIIDCL